MISQTLEYALRAMVDLAYYAGQTRTARQIADATKVPAGYLSKILKELSRHDLIHSQRGPTGGFTMEHDPSRITIYDVMMAVDPPKRITKCPLDLPEHRARLCPLHARLDDALAMIENAFKESTIAEVTADPTRGRIPGGAQKAKVTISGGLAPVNPEPRAKAEKRSARTARR